MLEFTHIKDDAGAAFYVLHTGNATDIHRFKSLKKEIEKTGESLCVLLDAKTPDGEKVRSFYGFHAAQLPVAFIVRDDDTLYMQWTGYNEIPTNPSDIAFQLRQVGGR